MDKHTEVTLETEENVEEEEEAKVEEQPSDVLAKSSPKPALEIQTDLPILSIENMTPDSPNAKVEVLK